MNIQKLLLRKLSGARAIVGISAIILCALSSNGQSSSVSAIVLPPVRLFPWGSIDAVTQFAVTNTRDVVVTLSQGNTVLAQNGYLRYSFTNLTDIVTAFQQSLVFGANAALTNPATVKNIPIRVVGYGDNNIYPPNFGSTTFAIPMNPVTTFSLINSNGVWELPDLTGIQASVFQTMPFYVPGLIWGRIEVYNADDPSQPPFLTVDSRYPASFGAVNTVNVADQVITMATAYLMSGNTGPYRLKVSLLTKNSFVIVDGNGMLVQEKPLSLQASVQNTTMSLTVTGGDPGRVFALEETTDLVTWSRLPGTYTVGTNANWSATITQPMKTEIPSQSFGIYRAVMLHSAPTQ